MSKKMKLLWLSDLHLNFLSFPQRNKFFDRIQAVNADAVLVGGDLSTARQVERDLHELRRRLRVPVYYVPGNHDYYHGSIAGTRELLRQLSRRFEKIQYLEDLGYVHISEDVALVGHGCWGDGGAGDFWNSDLELSDFHLIDELKYLRKSVRLSSLQQLGNEAAEFLNRFCREVAMRYPRVLVLTHVSPFPQTSLHEGRTDPKGLPFFSCKKAGDALISVAQDYPETKFLILSGHTHSPAQAQILPNLLSRVQGAKYYEPGFEILEIEKGGKFFLGQNGI